MKQLTLAKQFGTIGSITVEAIRVAKATGYEVKFEFNGVNVYVNEDSDCSIVATQALRYVGSNVTRWPGDYL